MTRISIEEVRHVASLARIEMSEEEMAVLQGELSALLDHVGQITRLDTSGVPPTAHPLELSNVLRPDVERPGLTPAEALAAAPAVEEGRYSVPSILGEAP
ncbi:MAG: Asp-tRNA(Asn)/Glu-tRNA(Gln) amidotransferase subunit GatC [Acidimicrobiales bacterium]